MNQPPGTSRIIPLEMIVPPTNPIRTNLDEHEFLALVDSMREIGQITAIVVVPHGDNFEIIAGHRRYLAAEHLRWPTLEARVVPRDEELNTAVKIHENSFREAVSPEDEGRYFDKIIREKEIGIKDLAKLVNRSHYYVQSRLHCTTFPANIKDALREKRISLGVASELSKINDEGERRRLLAYAADQGCSTKTAKLWVDTWMITQEAIDAENLKAPQSTGPAHYAEPHFPCYTCATPTPISQLAVIRMCEGCRNGLDQARNDLATTAPDNQGHQKTQGGASILQEAT